MADYNKQEQPDMEEQPRQGDGTQEETRAPGRGGVFLRRMGTLLVTALIVLGIVAVSSMGSGNFLDRFRRWLNYGAGGEESAYLFAADSNNQYAQIGEYLVVLTQNYLQFLEDSGAAYQSVEGLGLSQPVLDTGGGLAGAAPGGGLAGRDAAGADPSGGIRLYLRPAQWQRVAGGDGGEERIQGRCHGL